MWIISANKAALCLPLIFIISFFFPSCQLEPNPPGNIIEPRVLNCDGFSASLASYYWSTRLNIENYPIAVPDAHGYARFENVSFPYNLETTIYSQSLVHLKLNLRNPNIVLPDFLKHYISSIYNICVVPVSFPQIEPGDAAYVKFISKDLCLQDTLNFRYGNSTNLKIYIPIDKTEISGKLVFIECKTDYEYGVHRIISYEKFGTKEITVNAGQNDKISFSPQEIEFNPPETQVDITFEYPVTPDLQYSKVYLSFPGYNRCSDILVGYYYWYVPTYISQIVPTSLPVQFDIAVTGEYERFYEPLHRLITGTESIHMAPGSAYNISHSKLELLNPPDNQQGINQNSILSVNDEGENGIYLFYISSENPYSNVIVITSESYIRWGDLKFRNFMINQGTDYYWLAEKISAFNSIEEFTDKLYPYDQKYHSTQLSDLRHFKTAP